jgi:hypothetical protein
MQTQDLSKDRLKKIINYGATRSPCPSYLFAYWSTFNRYASMLPSDIGKWRPQVFATTLWLSIKAGYEACGIEPAAPDYDPATTPVPPRSDVGVVGQVRHDPEPVGIIDGGKDQIKNASRPDGITTDGAQRYRVELEGHLQQAGETIARPISVDMSIAIRVDHVAYKSDVLAVAGDQQGDGAR